MVEAVDDPLPGRELMAEPDPVLHRRLFEAELRLLELERQTALHGAVLVLVLVFLVLWFAIRGLT